MNLISDMAGEAVWCKWTAVSPEPFEVEVWGKQPKSGVEGGKQSNRFVRGATSEEDFGIFVDDTGEPAKREGDQTDEPSRDERHRPGPSA